MDTNGKRAFEEEWPALAASVRGWLSARGFPGHLCDDVVQETGLRLFRAWDRVDPSRSIRGFTFTIANNVLRDELKRGAVLELVESVPDNRAESDVEQLGIARLELKRVRRAFEELTDAHRNVLLAEIGRAEPLDRSPSAVKMLRMRARRRLSTLLERASASALVMNLRRYAHQILRRDGVPIFEGSGQTLAALCGAVALVVTMQGLPEASASRTPERHIVSSASLASPERAMFPALQDRLDATTQDAARGAQSRPARPAKEPVAQVVSKDGPIGAGVRRSEDDEGDLDPPSCSVEPRKHVVIVRCDVDTGEEEYEIEARADLEDTP
jgi:DNA-directed RNA polymerase specialized sigma24 family protein